MFVGIPLLASFLLPVAIGGKPNAGELARSASKAYLNFAKFAAIDSAFQFDSALFEKYAATNYNFSCFGVECHSTTGPVNASAIRYSELYGSSRCIFNTNQDFWVRTNFLFNTTNRQPVIICKQQFHFRRAKNYFGCSYSSPKPAYAVGFSDGTAELVSEKEYSNINLNGFIPLSGLGIEGFHVIYK